jgi:hypothetical protein
VDTHSGRRRRGHAGNHTSGKTVLHGKQVATLVRRYDVYHCNGGPQELVSDVDVSV